jgi:hypothetical protein
MSEKNQERESGLPSEEGSTTNSGNSPAPRARLEDGTETQRRESDTESLGSSPNQSTESPSQAYGATAEGPPDNGQGDGGENSSDETSQSTAFVSDPGALRRQWDSVQVGFVDDPHNAVREADALVSAAIEELSAGFSDQRSRLEAAWAGGRDTSTDDLRGAFRTYRDFFERLLSV